MTGRIRVVHIIQNLNYGGMERLLADIVRNLDPDQFESHVLCLQYLGRFAEGLEALAEVHLADALPRYSMLWPGPLIQQIRSIAPQVVHSHSGVWYKASLAARRARVARVIHTEHGRMRPDPWHHRLTDHLASRRTDVVVAVSDVLARQLEATVISNAARIQIVLNGVDTQFYRPRSDNGKLRRELGIPAAVPIIGSVGRLEQVKAYDVMIEAFVKLSASSSANTSPVLVVAGDGAERRDLARLIEKHGLRRHVYLLGWRDDIRDLHSAFTLFTMSSRSEGTSVSLLEAMSAGLCPVVTDVGGNAAVLRSELHHRLVVAEDSGALAEAWRAALTDAAGREIDGRTARRHVERFFEVKAMVKKYEQIYRGAELPAHYSGRVNEAESILSEARSV